MFVAGRRPTATGRIEMQVKKWKLGLKKKKKPGAIVKQQISVTLVDSDGRVWHSDLPTGGGQKNEKHLNIKYNINWPIWLAFDILAKREKRV